MKNINAKICVLCISCINCNVTNEKTIKKIMKIKLIIISRCTHIILLIVELKLKFIST